MEHARDEARVETEARLRGELVEELIAGEVVSRESIVRRARLLGADLSNGAVAMIGTLKEAPSGAPASSGALATRRFMSQVRAVLDLHWPLALVDWKEDRLLVLLPTPPVTATDEQGVDERAHALARRLLAATKDTVPGLAVTLALSRHAAEPEKLGAALDEAELALSIGERLGRHGDVVTFEETGTYKLLFQIFADRPRELSTFYEQTLDALVRYDEQYQTELVATLATYLELDGNLAATAATLYTHRHTVRYRLDRIAELSGLDVGKSDDREKLSLGLKAMRLLGKPVRTGPAEKPSRNRA
jgi:sugar diacid utilization regulator